MRLRPILLCLVPALLLLPLPSCVVVKIDSPAGARIKPDLRRGMSLRDARAAVARGGIITRETIHRFTAGHQPVLVAAPLGDPVAPPDLRTLPAAERARVARSVFLTRYYGILGLDDFTLLFDADGRLLSSDLQPVH